MQLKLFSELSTEIKGEAKVCTKCNKLQPLSSFRLYRRATGDRNSRDSKCKSCSKHANAVIAKLRITAPVSTGHCECCSKASDRLVLDHCHDTEVFRGWLCPPCNLGIGVLGDTKQGILNALNYLNKQRRIQTWLK